ncbi:hypothetical protein Py04_0603 [Pyrococcus sp. ST04]|nr:hypothetical protein Py04_0603 [Pyrococcus sp. ST04]
MKNVRKEYIFAGFFVLFFVLTVFAYTESPSYEKQELVSQVVQEGHLEHSAYLKNDTVFGRVASLRYYPTKITEAIYGNYSYSITPAKEGSYWIYGEVSYYVTKGKEKVYLINETIFNYKGKLSDGAFSRKFEVNLTKIEEEKKRLAEALSLPRISYDIKVISKVRTSLGEFKQEMPIVNDPVSGLTYIKGTDIEKKHNDVRKITINNTLLGMSVSTARLVFPILALISGVLALVLWKPKPRRRISAIEGVPKGISARVVVNSDKSLKKISKILGVPIIHYRIDGADIYGVIDGQVIYEWWAMRDGPESRQ